jgi:hypothetical protein
MRSGPVAHFGDIGVAGATAAEFRGMLAEKAPIDFSFG